MLERTKKTQLREAISKMASFAGSQAGCEARLKNDMNSGISDVKELTVFYSRLGLGIG